MAGGIPLAPSGRVVPDHCPLCGVSVALLRRAEDRAGKDVSTRITTLRKRANALERGKLTPRALKDQALWMCAACRHLLIGRPVLDPQEIQRRIHDEVRKLERRAS